MEVGLRLPSIHQMSRCIYCSRSVAKSLGLLANGYEAFGPSVAPVISGTNQTTYSGGHMVNVDSVNQERLSNSPKYRLSELLAWLSIHYALTPHPIIYNFFPLLSI